MIKFGRGIAFGKLKRAFQRLGPGALRDRKVRRQLRADWTAYCVRWGLAPGMEDYYRQLTSLWSVLREGGHLSSDDYWGFLVFMGRELPQRGKRDG